MHALADERVEADLYYSGMATLVEDYSPQAVVRVAHVVRERADEFKKKASTASEKAVIEVVALMFQSILSEDRIPPAVRVWFARLQVPVLRVALAEPEFFSDLAHPARQLIDRMGSCVLGFDASAINGGALETEIRRIVQVIEQYPETGKRVFELVLAEFEKFLAKFLTEGQGTARIISVAQQVEQRETLAIQYTIELRTMLKDMPVREEIRDFLFKSWAEVLAMSAVRNGAQHAETTAFKRAAADLVWAASAKPNRADRARVIQQLPALLQSLRQGLVLIGVTGAPQDAQIKLLTDTLAEAFLSKTASIPQEQIEAMAKRLANLEDFISDDTLGDMPLERGKHRDDAGHRRLVHPRDCRQRRTRARGDGGLGARAAAGRLVHDRAQRSLGAGAICVAQPAQAAAPVRRPWWQQLSVAAQAPGWLYAGRAAAGAGGGKPHPARHARCTHQAGCQSRAPVSVVTIENVAVSACCISVKADSFIIFTGLQHAPHDIGAEAARGQKAHLARLLLARGGRWRIAEALVPNGTGALQFRVFQAPGRGAQQILVQPLAAQLLQHALCPKARGAAVQHGFGHAFLVDEVLGLQIVEQRRRDPRPPAHGARAWPPARCANARAGPAGAARGP